MENGLMFEQSTLINELTQGMEVAKQLRYHLNSTSSAQSRELLLQRVLSSYEKALLILNWSGSVRQPQSPAPITGVPESSLSGDGSPRSEEFSKGFKDHQEHQNDFSKKRKVMPTWTDQVRVCSENGFEGPIDDGYSWRKYGQKDILGAKYPRSYYRCTYRNVRDCWATKQVQRSDDDPTVFEIIYRGKHTCNQNPNPSPPAPATTTLEKQEPTTHNTLHNHPSQDLLANLRTSLRVETEDSNAKEMSSSHFSFPSSSFGWMMNRGDQNFSFSSLVNAGGVMGNHSPATSELQCFSAPPCQMNGFGSAAARNLQYSEPDHPEIISANNSATNSPILDLDFTIQGVDLDPNFPFDTPGFFN